MLMCNEKMKISLLVYSFWFIITGCDICKLNKKKRIYKHWTLLSILSHDATWKNWASIVNPNKKNLWLNTSIKFLYIIYRCLHVFKWILWHLNFLYLKSLIGSYIFEFYSTRSRKNSRCKTQHSISITIDNSNKTHYKNNKLWAYRAK